MARAKRTDRAEARRRYRAAVATEIGPDERDDLATDEADDAAPDRPAIARPPVRQPNRRSPTAAPTRSSGGTPPRLGLLGAFRQAAQPADIRADLQSIPWLVTRTRAVWLPSLIVVAAGVIYLAFPGQQIAAVVVGTLLAPPALIPPFLAGMLASRAAWVAGGIVGLVSGLMVAAITIAQSGFTAGSQSLSIASVAFFVLISPLFGLAVGAFAGFYRRFLRLSGPSAQARRAAAGRKSQSRRATR